MGLRNGYRLYLEYRKLCEQTRIMVFSIRIPINMHRECTYKTWQAFPFERKLYLIWVLRPFQDYFTYIEPIF